MNVKKNDNVIVITGKDKGKQGKILKTFPTLDKVIVEGVNMRNRRMRPRKTNEKGQVTSIALPIHVSNIQLFCPDTKRGTRVRFEMVKGKKVRISVKSGKEI